LRDALDRATATTGVAHTIECKSATPPISFDPALVQLVRDVADDLALRRTDIVSGAGHDACYVAGVAPTAMIFVPCAGGVSHNEAESISTEQAERGASVLLGAVARAATS
jgi:N-carbamoyl-L-amino-acid hydrolase